MNNPKFEEAVKKAQLGGTVLNIFGSMRKELEKRLEGSTKADVIAIYAMTLTDLVLDREHKAKLGMTENILREAGLFSK